MIASIAIFALLAAAEPAQEECVENQEEIVLSVEECEQEDEAVVLNTEEDSEYQDLAFFEDESEISEELAIADEE
ncbi:MAG: hypothetical protein K1X28_00695 [Parachlamydiales bacterium]|nr:hypothetical protein [Parachlamydiales bacterium]